AGVNGAAGGRRAAVADPAGRRADPGQSGAQLAGGAGRPGHRGVHRVVAGAAGRAATARPRPGVAGPGQGRWLTAFWVAVALRSDLVPRVSTASEWAKLERGIVQRVRALEAFLADVYGDGQIVRDGVLPRRLITSCEHFHREAAGIVPPNGVRIHVAGIDIVRDAQGNFRVLEDNLRSPSGVSYVMENRRTMARVFPNLFATHRVRAVGDYSSHL